MTGKNCGWFLKTVLLAVLQAASAIFAPSVMSAQEVSQKIRCVVIDAGHGGHDFGCVSADRKTAEKNIALSVALKFGDRIKKAYPDVKVIYTRSKDVFIPLAERADIANRNKADFFISIHVNSAGKSRQASGTETFTMGAHVNSRNFEISKRENSVILLEDDYKTKYEGFRPDSPESYIIFSLLQNAYSEQSLIFAQLVQKEYVKGPIKNNRGVKQAGFLVLWRTTMPSVLTEIGFMSNPGDLAQMRSERGRGQIADRLFAAFSKYKKSYEGEESRDEGESPDSTAEPDGGQTSDTGIEERSGGKSEAAPESAPEKASQERTGSAVSSSGKKDDITYSIQILSVAKRLRAASPDLKGRKDAVCTKSKGLYKYHIGTYRTWNEASKDLPKIRKVFKGAFIIKLRDGEVVGS